MADYNSMEWQCTDWGCLRSVRVTRLINSLPLIIVASSKLFELLFFRYVNSVEFHPSGTCIAAGGTDSTVKVCVCVSSILENWVQVNINHPVWQVLHRSTFGENDRSLIFSFQVWDIRMNKLLQHYQGNHSQIHLIFNIRRLLYKPSPGCKENQSFGQAVPNILLIN